VSTAPTECARLRTFAIANQKGGVGKTTTAINLGAALAATGKRVIIFDIDPQGNAATGLDIHPDERTRSSYDVLVGACTIEEAVMPTIVPNLFIVAGTRDLSGLETELMQTERPQYKLREALDVARAAGGYDYVLIDCPPSLNVLTVNALTGSDAVLVPLQCEFFALEGLKQLLETVSLVKRNLNPELDIQGIVLTMHDKRTSLSDAVANDVRQHLGAKVYDTVIPRNVRLSEAPSYGKPAIIYDLKAPGSQAYLALARELLARESAMAQAA
jgi:chromosome partitioning protein